MPLPFPAPSFFLYGEPPREVARHFLHVEALDDRARPAEWSIQAHSHARLQQLFLISAGSGHMLIDGCALAFAGPCVLLIPRRVIHSFTFAVESTGMVMTLAEAFFAEMSLREPAFADLFAAPSVVATRDEAAGLQLCLGQIHRELTWPSIAAGAAIEGALLMALAAVMRARGATQQNPGTCSRSSLDLVTRFREALEANWIKRLPIPGYAAMLATSPSRLRAACVAVAGQSPSAMLQSRAMLEAQRALVYSSLSISEVAYAVGFDDPAHFSRAFHNAIGCSPRRFRAGSDSAV